MHFGSACPNSVTVILLSYFQCKGGFWVTYYTSKNDLFERKSPIWLVWLGRLRTLEDTALRSEVVVRGGYGVFGSWSGPGGIGRVRGSWYRLSAIEVPMSPLCLRVGTRRKWCMNNVV